MDSLISVISELRKISNVVGRSQLELPQIITVGSQSSGKSSVLEGIVGWDFLPRGTGIVTRRPLILNLVNVPENDPKRKQTGLIGNWATFGHLPNEYFTDFEKVRKEIENDTVKVVGNDKNISEVPINLTIFSSKVIDLSLVDLPGITRVPVGNQAITIEEDIRKIIHEYIKSPKSLILAVTPANQDVATSDALHLAKKYDPEGKRTLCVLTKLDLMDKGTHAMKELTGQTIPVKLGIIGVLNRSQEEINNCSSIEDCLLKEEIFFGNNYPSISSKNGIKYLRKQLNKLLINHIAEHLPGLRDGINNLSIEQQAVLDHLGEAAIDEDQTKLTIQVIRKFSDLFKDLLNGYDDLDTRQLAGGAKIGREFRNFSSFKNIVADEGLTRSVVITAMRNAHA
uniref:Dynamin-type G domain-containing protein n=1 Tax=Panagrolaimus superbus TaxID=310955 RepID=A0A914Z153_9BILA